MPEIEKGEGTTPPLHPLYTQERELTQQTALEGMNASGGGTLPKGEGTGQGKGAEDSNQK